MGLKNKIEKVLNEYASVYDTVWSTYDFKDPLLDFFNSDVKQGIQDIVYKYNSELMIDSSTGVGKTTRTPWIAIMDKRITTRASHGTYIVYLFNKDTKEFYIALERSSDEAESIIKSQGYTRKEKSVKLQEYLDKEKSDWLAKLDIKSFSSDDKINSGKKEFDQAALLYKKYSLISMPSDEQIENDLAEMIEIYKEYVDMKLGAKVNTLQKTPVSVTTTKGKVKDMLTIKEIIDSIWKYANAKGFVFKKGMIENYYLSLKAKPFVILAGISGTGKTKLVELFAKAVVGEDNVGEQLLLVPVRPDWSDSTDLLGHFDLYNNYVSTKIIKFIVKANQNLNKPYFLCLDEMNLARVEYYLSDVLSIIETRSFDKEGKIRTNFLFANSGDVPEEIKNAYLSENLFIIGTVNMDETTFPFSKKVLDRANTIEFSEVDTLVPDFAAINIAKNGVDTNDAINSNSFLKAKYISIADCESKAMSVDKYCKILDEINDILKNANAHVGYRVRDEIVFYMLYNEEDKLISETEAMDNAIMQKILPRIQGNGSEVKGLIKDLEDFCNGKGYKNCEAKLKVMGDRCGEYGEGYTSYWL